MGRDKVFLEYQGAPLWCVQLEKLPGFAREIFISAYGEFSIHPKIPYTLVPDEVPGLGPLGGLVSVLKKARYERVLLLAVDMPMMTEAFLAKIVGMATEDCGVIPEAKGFFQGLAAVYPRKILPLLEEVLRGENHSLQHFNQLAIAEGWMKLHQIEESDEGLFENWNTPEDLLRETRSND